MINFLHSFLPQPIILTLGPISLRWYGLFLVLGISAGILISLKISDWYKIKRDYILDLAIWLIIGGVIGARLYEIFLELPFYLQNPAQMIKVWEGGLAIHGAIIGGLLTLFLFSYLNKLSALKLITLVVPGVALGQSIGRWGNWFNQELFGQPTALAWGIPIALENRPIEQINAVFFHPTFLYESLGCLLIFVLLFWLSYHWRNNINQRKGLIIIALYFAAYAILRFMLEFIKIDHTPLIFGWRWPQIMSLIFIIFSTCLIFKALKR
jgi:phosphatidylglycerol:prolipoprotein diacylglycerol transferase